MCRIIQMRVSIFAKYPTGEQWLARKNMFGSVQLESTERLGA